MVILIKESSLICPAQDIRQEISFTYQVASRTLVAPLLLQTVQILHLGFEL
jgi:hypothetical protein